MQIYTKLEPLVTAILHYIPALFSDSHKIRKRVRDYAYDMKIKKGVNAKAYIRKFVASVKYIQDLYELYENNPTKRYQKRLQVLLEFSRRPISNLTELAQLQAIAKREDVFEFGMERNLFPIDLRNDLSAYLPQGTFVPIEDII